MATMPFAWLRQWKYAIVLWLLTISHSDDVKYVMPCLDAMAPDPLTKKAINLCEMILQQKKWENSFFLVEKVSKKKF